MGLLPSWVDSANAPHCDFPLNNLALGVFDTGQGPRCGVAIGDRIVDATALEAAGLLDLGAPLLAHPSWNALMTAGPAIWAVPRPDDRPVAQSRAHARPSRAPSAPDGGR